MVIRRFMDFARVLLVGAIMMGILYFVTVPQQLGFTGGGGSVGGGGTQWKPASREVIDIGTPSTGQKTTLTSASEFFVGSVDSEAFNEINLPRDAFIISHLPRPSSLASADDAGIRNGLLEYKKERMMFKVEEGGIDDLKDIVLMIKVLETNSLGKLSVIFNGNLAFSGYLPKGEKAIPLDLSLLKEENTLDIETSSSGWRLWAPAAYVIDAEVRAQFLQGEEEQVKFSASREEVDRFKLGRLVFSAEPVNGGGNMTVKLNGREIFSGSPKKEERVDFRERPKEGENSISISSLEEGEYKVSLQRLLLFYDTKVKQTIEKGVLVSQADYNQLPGAIEFTVKSIIGSPSSLNMVVIDAQNKEHKFFIGDVIKQNKTVSVEMTQSDVSIGVNKAIISATGEGGFEIVDFRVRY